jgi:hypothetical protein
MGCQMISEEFIKQALDRLSYYFETCEIAELWLYTDNPNFGYKSPIAMYDMGRGDFVLNFIDDAIEENRLV